MFTPMPLYVAGIVYAIHRRVCYRCCCPNKAERAEKEAQNQERRENGALRLQAREQKKLKKQNKTDGQEGSSDGSNEQSQGPEEVLLKPVTTTENYIERTSDLNNIGISLDDQPVRDVDKKHEVNQQPTALMANFKDDNQFKVEV